MLIAAWASATKAVNEYQFLYRPTHALDSALFNDLAVVGQRHVWRKLPIDPSAESYARHLATECPVQLHERDNLAAGTQDKRMRSRFARKRQRAIQNHLKGRC